MKKRTDLLIIKQGPLKALIEQVSSQEIP